MKKPPLLGLLALSCSVAAGILACAPAPKESTANTEGGLGAHVIVDMQGQVSIKRPNWKIETPASLGTMFRRGDQLQLKDATRVRIVCSDLSLVQVATRTSGSPCESPTVPPQYQGSAVQSARGGLDDFQVLSPRKTKLLSERPTLRWTEMPGASTYKVTLYKEGKQKGTRVAVWSKDVGPQTELQYPTAEAPLQAGDRYWAAVLANNRSTDATVQQDEVFEILGFDLVGQSFPFGLFGGSDARALRAAESSIRALDVTSEPKEFLVGILFTRQNLNADAIEHLEALGGTPWEPAASKLLGDVYEKVGLINRAERRYGQTLTATRSSGDVEGVAVALEGLGRAAQLRGDASQARACWQEALETYQQLGDPDDIDRAHKKLAELPAIASEAPSQRCWQER